jgi:hypothetical protein
VTQANPIDTTVPHSVRVWNYWLGGKDNYQVDRDAGDEFAAKCPEIFSLAKLSRQFLVRAVRHLVTEAGVRQFLDIGTGLPTMDNTHQVRIGPRRTAGSSTSTTTRWCWLGHVAGVDAAPVEVAGYGAVARKP